MLTVPENITPVELPKLSAEQVERDNLFAARGGRISVMHGDTELRLSLVPPGLSLDPSTTCLCVAANAAFALSVAERRLSEFYPDGVADVQLASLPESLAKALMTVALRPLMSGIDRCLGGPIIVEKTINEMPSDWRRMGLYAQGDRSRPPVALMHLSPEADVRLMDYLRARSSAAVWPAASDAPVPVSFGLRGFVLSRHEYARLRPGSAILLPAETDPNRLSIFLGVGSQLVGHGRPEDNVMIVEDLTVGAMNDEDENNTDGAGDEEPAEVSLDDVGVRVDFVVGQTLMTFAELQALAPGFAIKLDVPVSQAVKVMVSGRVVGEGELVQIDDRLGVRIVRLVEKKDG